MNTKLALLLVGVIASGCATMPSAPLKDALAARFALADAQRAQTVAPDLYARAERARQDARHSDDAAARTDHEVRAQLLLEAAIAESDRIAAERTGAATDARAEQLIEQRAELGRQRLELEQAAQREVTARAARAAATRAETHTAPAEAAAFVRDRTALTLAAAIALGLDSNRADELERAIARAQLAPTGTARVTAAKRVLAQVQAALDATRAAQPSAEP